METDDKMNNKNSKREPIETIGLNLGGIFGGLEKLIQLASELEKNNGEIRSEQKFSFGKKGAESRGVFGVRVQTIVGGEPITETFGNIKQTPNGPIVSEEREPMTDVFDELNEIKIYAEMPGVSESDIEVELNGDILEIRSTQRGLRKYRKELLLKESVDIESLRKYFHNGILEIILSKKPS